MKLTLLLFTTLLYLFSPMTSAAEMKIYQWVDENGKTHFSDTAVPGTEEVQMKHATLLESDQESNAQEGSIAGELNFADEGEAGAISYQATITSPADDQPVRSNDGTIDIHIETKPEKENSQKLQLYLDGKKLGSPQISPNLRASNIDRGTHQIQVELLDESGNVLAKTQIVTVHLQRQGN